MGVINFNLNIIILFYHIMPILSFRKKMMMTNDEIVNVKMMRPL